MALITVTGKKSSKSMTKPSKSVLTKKGDMSAIRKVAY